MFVAGRWEHWSIRTFRPGDASQCLQLWNLSYGEYAGLVKRTLDDWKWAIVDRPQFEDEDFVVLEGRNGIAAYGVLLSDGSILELAVDPQLSRRKRRVAFSTLLDALEQRARDRGMNFINCSLPTTDRLLDSILQGKGYVMEPADTLSLGIVNPKELLSLLLEHHRARLPGDWFRTFMLKLTPGDYPYLAQSQLWVSTGQVITVDDQSPCPQRDPQIVICCDLCLLTELIFRRTTFDESIRTARLHVEPSHRVADAARLFNALAIDAPWYTAPSHAF